jgi:hypothetical protein
LIRFLKFTAAVALALLIAACGSSNNNSSPASVRLINASHTANLTLTLNGAAQFSNVASGSATGYDQVTASTYTLAVASSSGTLASSTQVVGLASSQTYSVLAYDRDGAIVALVVAENQTVPTAGFSLLGISNDSPDCGALDVYVVAPGTSTVVGLTPTFSQVGFGAAPLFTTLVSGTYEIVATASGNPNDVRFKTASQQLTSTQIALLGFTSTSGGALVNGVFANQGTSSVSFSQTTNARVRVVSALPPAGASPVAATVGTTALAPVFSPNPGTYTLVPGGTTSYSISISGTAVAGLPAATFATGGDFTILVYNTTASPVVTILTDNNQAPIAGDVNLRLVNAAVTTPGGVTVYDNNVAIANSVAYGAAAPYFGVTEAANSTLEFDAQGIRFLDPNVSLNVPAAVYTIFVIDSTSPLTLNSVSIIRDR